MFRRLAFNFWYLRKPPWDSGISPPELLQFINSHQSGKAIDLGCGTGTNVITLAHAGWQVTGIDFASHAINIAKQKLKKENIQAELHVGDVTKLDDITGQFDLALDIGCFHGLTQTGMQDYLNQLDRILAPNRFWLLYSFLASSGTLPPAPGLAEVEIDILSSRFNLLFRQNGFERHKRPSAWFLFQTKKKNL